MNSRYIRTTLAALTASVLSIGALAVLPREVVNTR